MFIEEVANHPSRGNIFATSVFIKSVSELFRDSERIRNKVIFHFNSPV